MNTQTRTEMIKQVNKAVELLRSKIPSMIVSNSPQVGYLQALEDILYLFSNEDSVVVKDGLGRLFWSNREVDIES